MDIECLYGVDDFWHGGRDVAKVPREHAYVGAALVHLDPRAVQFPFERDVAVQLIEGLVHVRHRLREHRLHRLKHADAKAGEAGLAVDQGGARHGSERAGHHRGSPQRRRVDAARPRDGFDEHAFEGALTELSEEEPADEVLLGASCPAQKIAKTLLTRRGGARSFH